MAFQDYTNFDTKFGAGGIGGASAVMSKAGIRDPDVQDQLANQRLGYQNQLDLANIGNQPALLAANQKQNRFQTLFPLLKNQMFNAGKMATAGGQSGASPEISVGGVLNPQQIQQQVNSMRAGNDQTGATQMAKQTADTSGRGFGSNSPLLQALHGQTQANTLAQNVGGERDIRLGAAQKNAGQLLNTQQAREQQFASRQNEDLERRKPYFSLQNTLLSSLAGLV